MNNKMNFEILKFRFKSHYAVGFFFIALVTAAVHLTGDNRGIVQEDLGTRKESNEDVSLIVTANETAVTTRSCDLFAGRWIYDNVSRPLYEERQCHFMLNGFACEKYGRKDVEYQKWRWQPRDCDLPRFNGTKFLEKIRGKRLVFVGDSLNKNQWTSLLCLIESSLDPSSNKSIVRKDNLFTLEATEYNATIALYWAPFLVESNCDDPLIHHVEQRVVKLMGIDKHARHWNDADILIFNNYLWWMDPITIVWGSSLGSSDAINQTVSMNLRLYEMALDIWSDWLEININRTKTKMFFMSPSPFHLYGKRWEEQRNCYNETEPIVEDSLIGLSIVGEKMKIAETILEKLGKRGINLEYLNITHLSEYRKDGHPSIYKKFFRTISDDQLSNPPSYSDCTHWCLPGVPDVWNEILYSYIMNS